MVVVSSPPITVLSKHWPIGTLRVRALASIIQNVSRLQNVISVAILNEKFYIIIDMIFSIYIILVGHYLCEGILEALQ
jgi:hypothetical protein